MNTDKTITLTVVIGILILTVASMFVYGATGKDVTLQVISGLFGFVSGVVVNLPKKSDTIKTIEPIVTTPVQGDVNNEQQAGVL